MTVKGAGVGTVFPGIACAIGRDVYAFEPQMGIDARFAEHVIRFDVAMLLQHAVGDIPGLSRNHLADFEIPLPPLPEQHRIVETIESYFTRLDDAVATLERVQRNLKRCRASLLKAALGGRLVPNEAAIARAERREYEHASVLLERILVERRRRWEGSERKGRYQEPFTPKSSTLPSLPEGWCWTTVDVIAEVQGGITKNQKRRSSEPMREVPYLRVANVQRGYLDLTRVATIAASEAEIAELRLSPGDVLFNEGGDRDKLGRGWVWRGELAECIHQNHVFRARPVASEISSQFLSWYGNTEGQRYFFDEGKQTTNLASINMTKLRSLPVPLPPAAEQRRIVLAVEDALSLIDAACQTGAAGNRRCARLGQSILKWAFEGKLAEQDPNDESASVLLERIKSERAAGTPPKMARASNGRPRKTA